MQLMFNIELGAKYVTIISLHVVTLQGSKYTILLHSLINHLFNHQQRAEPMSSAFDHSRCISNWKSLMEKDDLIQGEEL